MKFSAHTTKKGRLAINFKYPEDIYRSTKAQWTASEREGNGIKQRWITHTEGIEGST